MLDAGIKIEKMVVASSMSIYGEGKYLCVAVRRGGSAGANAAAVEGKTMGAGLSEVRAKSWHQCLQTNRSPCSAARYYALSKKDQEEMVLLFGRTYGLPAVALTFLQHLRNTAGALESVHRSGGNIRLALAERACTAGF